jgi:hypothetical protein
VLSRAHGRATGQNKGRPELADIFRHYGQSYAKTHRLSGAQQKVMRAVETCRTAELGGHLKQCDRCGFEHPSYNSVTATAPNASPWPKPSGFKSRTLSFCRWAISIWCLPCPTFSTV